MDTAEVNTKKIKSSVTDTGREVRFDEKEKPGVSNLLTIYSALTGKTVSDSEKDFDGKGYGDFKGAVAEVVVEYFRPVRAKALELLEDPAYLTSLLKIGADKASAVANKTLADTYEAMGLIPRA